MLKYLVASLALLCSITSARAESIRIGYIPIADCLQLYVADELGYFKAQGLVVEKTPLNGGALIAMAVEGGELDAGWSNTASLAIAQDRGFDFAILSPGAFEQAPDRREHSLLVAKSSPIRTVADLKGKTVGINALGNINEIAVAALAAQHGLSVKQMRLVEIPFPQMEAALTSGHVDAVLTLEPFVTIARNRGATRVLEPAALKPFGKRMLIAAWFAKRSWLDRHKAAATAFALAMRKASAYIEKNPAQARELLTRHTKLSLDLAQQITLPLFAQKIEDSDVQGLIDEAARFGYIKKAFPAQRLSLPAAQP